MTTKKAIDILKHHQEKLFGLPANHQKFSSWKVQALTFIETFFKEGRNSNEYTVLQAYNYFPGDGDTITAEQSKSYLSWFIGDCIQTIKSIGVYKEPKRNFLTRYNEGTLVTIIIFAVTVLFSGGTLLGKYLSDTQNIELKRKVEDLQNRLNAVTSPSTNNKPNTVTGKEAHPNTDTDNDSNKIQDN